MKRRDAMTALGGGTLALLLGPTQIAWGATIVAVRVWPADDYTRVTIESDRPLSENHFVADAPSRLVIDVDGLDLSPALRELVGKVRADDPYIDKVRVGQYKPRVVRLVIDLKQPVAPQLFALTPIAAYQNRLVFDLYPVHERDPLLALIRDKETAEQHAAREVRDALGEFIGQVGRPDGAGSNPVAAAASPNRPAADAGEPPHASASASASASGPKGSRPSTPASPSTPATDAATTAAANGRSQPPEEAADAAERRTIDRLVVIAIDPGHGGEDPGASGATGLHEKDVVLQVGLMLRDRLDAVPNFRVMMTRDADFFVPLHERVKKARRVQADLFVSIHADAFLTPDARGASVFALSESGATSAAARWMANKENSADLVGGVNIKSRDAEVMRALLDMSTTAQINHSLKLGDEVLGQIGKVGKLHKGSVEQAGFAVLKAPDVPSILVETAFISNPDEEAKLRDPEYQHRLVEALTVGIQRYFKKYPPRARVRQV